MKLFVSNGIHNTSELAMGIVAAAVHGGVVHHVLKNEENSVPSPGAFFSIILEEFIGQFI